MSRTSHFQTLSKPALAWRKFYHETLGRLGVSSHVVRAQGARFRVNTVDHIDRCLALFGIWEQDQLDDLGALATARKIDCFLDVGANAGVYSIMFALRKWAGRIIAFEPDPGNYARLMANLTLNDLQHRVEAVPLALGDRASDVKLYEGANWNRGESTIAVPEQTPQEISHIVQQARFDELYALSGQTIIIKMDVEGYEFHSLAGMERTLRDNACYLQVELYSDRIEELKALLVSFGYRYLHTHDIDHFFTNIPEIR